MHFQCCIEFPKSANMVAKWWKNELKWARCMNIQILGTKQTFGRRKLHYRDKKSEALRGKQIQPLSKSMERPCSCLNFKFFLYSIGVFIGFKLGFWILEGLQILHIDDSIWSYKFVIPINWGSENTMSIQENLLRELS